jgi:transcriptional regulator with XRE-family HTH domain
MNRLEFGKLLATLRQDMDWTQFQLAEYAGVDEPVVSQLERGVKKHFEPDLLFRLANVLQLTTLERREFFLAASGLDDRQIVRQPSAGITTDAFDAQKILKKMIALAEEARFPTFVIDVYSDVIAANKAILSFYKVPSSMLENADRVPGGFNAIRLAFGRELVTRTQIAENWENYAINTMRAFRETSLRYRTRPYFQYLMKAFRNPIEYPFFDRFWKQVSAAEQDKEANMDHFHYRHAEFGDLKYISSSTFTLTAFGELFLNQYLPLDGHTHEIFEKLAGESGEGVVRFASWPNKSMPE